MKRNERQASRFLFGLAGLLILLGSPAFADDTRQGVEAANREFEAAASRRDSAGVSALYTVDGQALPTGSDFVTGTAAIAAMWQASFDAGINGATLKTVEVEAHGDTAIEVGTYELRTGEGKVADHGKYIVIWKKQGDTWKIHRDIFNTSIAPE